MRNISSFFRSVVKALAFITVFSLGVTTFAQAQDVKAGEALFKANCTTCHKLNARLVGPALAGVNDRHDAEWLHKWIKNSQAMVQAGDEKAVALFNEYKTVMTPFTTLKDDEITNILAYIKAEGDKKPDAAAGGAGGATGAAAANDNASSFMLVGLIVVILLAFFVIVVLNRVIRTLERVILKNKDLKVDEDEENIKPGKDYAGRLKKLAKNKKLVFFAVLMVGGLLTSLGWKDLWNVGVHTNYQPVQPIKFSHQLHAGVNQIECQYCHSGAFKSKNASIPSANICMNCHKGVTGSEQYGGETSPEIAKIYRALDWDPKTQVYGNNPKPIEWVRIHNLPDFAYFNHSQHVSVAGVKCQTCHGPVETMETVYQYSPLTMKWCINCHQVTEVNHKDNAYYDQLIAAHDKLKKGEKVTAAMLGGLECGKCHY